MNDFNGQVLVLNRRIFSERFFFSKWIFFWLWINPSLWMQHFSELRISLLSCNSPYHQRLFHFKLWLFLNVLVVLFHPIINSFPNSQNEMNCKTRGKLVRKKVECQLKEWDTGESNWSLYCLKWVKVSWYTNCTFT